MKRLLTKLDDTRQRLSSVLQRRARLSKDVVLSRKRRFFSSELLLSASILFLPVLYMTAALALLSDVGLGRWVFPTGLLLWASAVAALHREERWQRLAATLLLFLAAFALVAFLTSLTLDRGNDSRFYHAKAIFDLLEGINPYWQPERWVTFTYPAAHWLLSSSLIVWTQSFETSFAFTIAATLTTFFCSKRFLETLPRFSRGKSLVWRNVLAVLLAANPIAISSFFNHLVDGLFASTLLSVFLLMLCFVSEDKRQSRATSLKTALYVVALLVLLVNIKFTGLVYGGILGIVALAYGIRRKASRQSLLRLVGLGCGGAVLGVALFGFFPYATNVAQDRNPFYPAIQFDEQGRKIDTLAQFFDPKFYNRSSYEKWWIALFSRQGRSFWDPAPLPPFSSLTAWSFQHGFSSFFSGALLLCLTLVFFVRHRGAWIVLAGVMVSILSTGASFEFRLTPQNWWLPVLFLVFLFSLDEKQPPLSRAQRAVAFVVATCLLWVFVGKLLHYGKPAIMLSSIVRQAERQGGWFVTPDLEIEDDRKRQEFFHYYKSGLSGVRLPTLSECPDKAEQRTPIYGLLLCKP